MSSISLPTSTRRGTKVHHLPPMPSTVNGSISGSSTALGDSDHSENVPNVNKKQSSHSGSQSSTSSTVPHSNGDDRNTGRNNSVSGPHPPKEALRRQSTIVRKNPVINSTTTANPSSSSAPVPRPPTKKRSSSLLSKADRAFQAFSLKYPDFNGKTSRISRLRSSDFSRLDQDGHVYLDFTGAGLHAESQVKEHMKMMTTSTLGNPHSANPTAMAATTLVENTRADVLKFFNANPNEYDVIFTNNCSGALKIIGESYPFTRGSTYLLPTDNHNSVNGIREFAKSKGAAVKYLPVDSELRLEMETVIAALKIQKEDQEDASSAISSPPRLFAFPAQSNFSGVKHPLELIEIAQAHGWDVLLDAAAFAPTSKIDLSVLKPDFMTLSFYKMFGYPTGLGALIMKRSIMETRRLVSNKPWFAGGTVEMALATGEKHWLHQDHEAFEDGTINFLGIPAISIGLNFLQNKCGGMDLINSRIQCMTSYLLDELKGLKHSSSGSKKTSSSSSSLPLIKFYGPTSIDSRGGTLAFNVFDLNGECISCWEVEELANDRNISIRAGCFCNPGDSEAAFEWDVESLMSQVPEELKTMTKSKLHAVVPVAGAVRVSVGVPTNFKDLYACVNLFKSLRNLTRQQVQDLIAEKKKSKSK